MTRIPFIGGNWKMNLTPTAAVAFVQKNSTKITATFGG